MKSNKIRIMVADDHEVVRIGLTTLLGAFVELDIVGEATDGQAAVEMCETLLPDVVLMDMNMPVMDGIEATRMIHQRHPQIKVIALTAITQEELVQRALRAGATGYVLKNVSPDELIHAIHSAVAGQITLSAQAVQYLLHAPEASPAAGLGLTEREHEVLSLMVDGLANSAIADRLHVSIATVKSHVSNILTKLNVATRAEAVALAMRLGYYP